MARQLETNWVIIATSGSTADNSGRVIKKEWLTAMAKHYDPDVYTAKIWMDHRRWMPTGGKVVALKAEKATHPELTGEIHLKAKLAPNDWLIDANRRGQYVHTSIEVNEVFMGGKYDFYLGGLGATDNPASAGTDELHFSGNEQSSKKIHCFNGKAINVAESLKTGFLDKLFSSHSSDDDDTDMTPEQLGQLKNGLAATLKAEVNTQFAQTKTDLEAHIKTELQTQFSALKPTEPEETPAPSPAPAPTPTPSPTSSDEEEITPEKFSAMQTQMKEMQAKMDKFSSQRDPLTVIPDGGEGDTDPNTHL